MIGKQYRTLSRVVNRMGPFKHATQKGELSHGDIAGGGKIVRTLGGAHYVFALTDDKSDMTEIHLLKKKSEAFPQLKKFAAKLKAQRNPMQRFKSDDKGEFDSAACKEWMQTERIQWEPTTPYNPYQNGVTERCFRTIFARTRAMLYDAGLPNNKWGEALSTAVYLKNGSPTKSLKGITLYESDTGKPDLSNLRNFGGVAHHHNDEPKSSKLSNHGTKCVFLGYEGRNRYRLWDPLVQ